MGRVHPPSARHALRRARGLGGAQARARLVARGRHGLAPDIVSFGVAPAALGYTVGLDGGWDAAVLIAFVVCGISRLARCNVTAGELADDAGKVRYYQGTPIPTSLAIVLELAVAFARNEVGPPARSYSVIRRSRRPWEETTSLHSPCRSPRAEV